MTSWVNPKITVKNIGEKGAGSFANELILSGEIAIVQGGLIMDYQSIEKSDYKAFCDHCFQIEKDLLICPLEPKIEKLDGIFQVNHSCNPNCGFRGQTVLVAMKNIDVGDEITYDYAMTDAGLSNVICSKMQCLCMENNCRHTITGEDWKLTDLQEKYKGYFSTYIKSLIEKNAQK